MNHPGPVAAAANDSSRGSTPEPPAKVGSPAPDPSIRRRLRRALKDAQPWRTVERLAIEAAVPEEVAASVLRADDDVRFSRGRDGRTIVGLISRVGT